MKVLQIMAGSNTGGAETAFADTVLGLHKAGLKQHAIIRKGAPCAAIFKEQGLPFTALSFRKPFGFMTKRTIRNIIKEFQPYIVQTWMKRATSMCPVGDFVHVGWFGGYYSVPHFSNCDYLVGVTPDISRHHITEGRPQEETAVLRTFCPIMESTPVDRKELDTPADAPLLLNLARLHPKKGIDILLKALVDVPKAYLWIAGEGPLREELIALAKDLKVIDRVRFLGWRDDRVALLQAADICVFPSRYEPFGTVMVEAWAYKVPLIAAASAGPKAHVKNMENGLLIPIDDVDALSKAINLAIEDKSLANRMVDNGYQYYKATFTEEKIMQSYQNFYERIYKRGKTRGLNAKVAVS